mmetsp:Transcript_13621/g.37837  ORF Transcript_13621/g.37837 Transcript_13621/m.37837 type:complete len:280 (+) Transcript_13621:673-1512(+)
MSFEPHLFLEAGHVPPVDPPLQLLPKVACTLDLAAQLPPFQRRPAVCRHALLVLFLLNGLRKVVRLHCDVQLARPGHEALGPEEETEEGGRIHAQRLLLNASLPFTVVLIPQAWVGQDLIHCAQLLELRSRLGVPRVLVGVALPGLPVVGLLDLRSRCARTDLEQVVKLRVRHRFGRRATTATGSTALILAVFRRQLPFERTQVQVDPLAELLVPHLLLSAGAVGDRGLHEAPADLRDAAGRAYGDHAHAADEAHAEPLDETQGAALLSTQHRRADDGG